MTFIGGPIPSDGATDPSRMGRRSFAFADSSPGWNHTQADLPRKTRLIQEVYYAGFFARAKRIRSQTL